MNRKPSMFSKNYRKELKQRRIRRVTLSISVLLIVGGAIFIFNHEGFSIKGYFAKDDSENIIETSEEVKDKNSQGTVAEKENTEENESSYKTEAFEVNLNANKTVTVELNEYNDKKTISKLQCPDKVLGKISPSQEKGLIIDTESQDIYIVDISKEIKNITNQQYISTDNQVFTKETVLQYNKDYKWLDDAGFINETHIGYSSQLPWINEDGLRYLWIVNINDNTHKGYYNVNGREFKFVGNESEGGVIDIDGKTVLVNENGQIVSN